MSKVDLLNGLTSEQKKAVTHTTGPILVVAGAGTGKTTIITRRIAWLIGEKHAKPEEILALTFTEKAATEMTTRVDELSDYIYSGLTISTFHSFGAEIISEFAFDLGLPANFKVLTDVEQILFIRDHIFDFNLSYYASLSDPTSVISEMVKVFSRAKDECITPKMFIANAESRLTRAITEPEKEEAAKELEIAKSYEVYNNLLRKNGYIDYGDQINLVLELLKKPSVAKKLKERFKYALVDEFQDTNFAQTELVHELFGSAGNVMVVGDDDQSIYRFRGASISGILNFRDTYKKVETIVLTQNFRSTQNILDAAYTLIQNNNPERLEAKYQVSKKLKANTKTGTSPELMLFETESQEAEAVAEKIIEGKKRGKNFSDFAILFRANSHAGEFVRTLAARGIPYLFSGAAGLYEKIEVKMLVSLTRALACPEDDLAHYHLAMSDVYDFNASDLAKLSHWSHRHNKSLSSVLASVEPLVAQLGLSPNSTRLAPKIIQDLAELREESKTDTAGEVVNSFLRKSGYYGKLTREAKEGSVEAAGKISNIAAFFDKIIHFQRNYNDHSLAKFAEYLNLILEAGDDPKPFEVSEGLDAVSVLTIHKSKGLEFDTVFISSLSDSHFPGRGTSEKIPLPGELVHADLLEEGANIREERRLFYVAATRAKNHLYLSAALDYGTKRTHKISRFVTEMLGNTAVEKRFFKTEAIERIKHFEKVETLYNIALEPISDSERLVFSRAQIDDFLTCPFKYQLVHVTPIRIMADSNIAYGNAIHNTIGEYYKRRMAKKAVTLKEVIGLFETFWDETGFLSRAHEEKRFKAGKEALKNFYQKAEKEDLPQSIEKEFKFALGNNIIRGRYDAIFKTAGGFEVFDFKTSQVKKLEEAEKRTKESTQLATYALSLKKLTGKLPKAVHLYFVESGLVGTYVPTEKDAAKTEEEILTATAGIRARQFKATPDLYKCKYCPFKFYCPEAILPKVSS